AINVVLMHRRALRSRPSFAPGPTEAELDDEDLPDEQLMRRRRVAALYRLLDGMSEKKRTVYVLHELEGLTPAEIAKVVGAPVLTVRTRLFYARRALLAQLAGEPALAALAQSLGPLSDPAPARAPHKEPACIPLASSERSRRRRAKPGTSPFRTSTGRGSNSGSNSRRSISCPCVASLRAHC